VEDWDPSAIQDWLADRKIKWKFAPAGGQHMNGQAERMIRQVKNVLKSTLEGKSCSFNELTTILFEAAIIVNSRPIGIAGREFILCIFVCCIFLRLQLFFEVF
jgi:transposase InsO family protein